MAYSDSGFVCFGIDVHKLPISDKKQLEIFESIYTRCIILSQDKYTRAIVSVMTDEEKKSFLKNKLLEQYLQNYFQDNVLTVGGLYHTYIGIDPETFIKVFPNRTFGDTRKIVAEELNARLDTDCTEADIEYYQEGWDDTSGKC